MKARGYVKPRLFSLWLAMTLSVLSMVAFAGTAFAAEGATITTGTVSAAPGETVTVPVTIKDSPGVLGATLTVTYDEGLTLANVSSGSAWSNLTMASNPTKTSPCTIVWDGQELSDEDVKDGEILLLTFDVSSSATRGATLSVSVKGLMGDIFDGDMNAINVDYTAGGITVQNYLAGDVDDDFAVTSKDVIYARRQITGGYNQSVNWQLADVDNSGALNAKDLILMRRYIVGGYEVELQLPSWWPTSSDDCDHGSLTTVPLKNPTCTKDGNIAYWVCNKCGSFFTDKACIVETSADDVVLKATGHTVVYDQGVSPSTTGTGLTEGSHCLVCGVILKAQEVIPTLESGQYAISYSVANGDDYLASLNYSNPNPVYYTVGETVTLQPLSIDGYDWLGWYDGSGDSASEVTQVGGSNKGNITLYARLSPHVYTVTFNSDLSLESTSATYKVNEGLTLTRPSMPYYTFSAWTDSDGNVVSEIPIGTTGNLTLNANWSSERNKTWTNPNPSNPIVYEDEENNVILFTYEIGRIENVPLDTILDYGYLGGESPVRTVTTTHSSSTSTTTADQLTKVVASATTNSSSWSLSNGWSESTSVNSVWQKTKGYSDTEVQSLCQTDSSNWNVSNSTNGSTSVTNASSTKDGWSNQIKNTGSKSSTTGTTGKVAAELDTKLSATAGVEAGIDDLAKVSGSVTAEIGTKISGELSTSKTSTSSRGFEATGTQTHEGTSSSSATNTAGWSNTASYGGSSTTSKTDTVSKTLSEQISEQYGYGKQYILSGDETQGIAKSSTDSTSNSYSSTVTYNTATSDSVTDTYTNEVARAGYHRFYTAGTMHVFAVVGYDISTKSFFVYTINVMDDATHTQEDYSPVSADFSDHENGVISFEIPYSEVVGEVSNRVYASSGLKVDLDTGTVVGYSGSDTCVVIPEYYNVNGEVVKITGVSSSAFKGNKDIKTVLLSDYVTQIPESAFEGCSSLEFVSGQGVTSIGASAFAGCSSMKDCGVYSEIAELGNNAFEGVSNLYVNASNAEVAQAAVASGAKRLTLNLALMSGGDAALDGVVFETPETMDYFELAGSSVNSAPKTCSGLRIDSSAGETVLRRVSLSSEDSLTLKTSSSKVTLDYVKVSSPGIAMALCADTTDLYLNHTISTASDAEETVICKNLNLYELNSSGGNQAQGKLSLSGNLLTCGNVRGTDLLQCANTETIDEATFNGYLHPYTLKFETGVDTCSEASRVILNGNADIGELPVPEIAGGIFTGWYLDGEQVTAESTFYGKGDVTLTAKWSGPLADGVYSIYTTSSTEYAVDNLNSSFADGNSTVIHDKNYTEAQGFMLSYDENDATYQIKNVLTGKVLAAADADASGNVDIKQATIDVTDARQKWYLELQADGTYGLRNKANNLYMNVAGATFASSTNLECGSSNGSAAQRFSIRARQFIVFVTKKLSWTEAEKYCESLGGHLATVTSQSEQSYLNSVISAAKGTSVDASTYWLGAQKIGTSFQWVTGEDFNSYQNWNQCQPDNLNNVGTEIYLEVYTGVGSLETLGAWNDVTRDSLHFICEWN